MTADKNFKREVRARMKKTGESYSIARQHVMSKHEASAAEPTTPPAPATPTPELVAAPAAARPKRFDPNNFQEASPRPDRGDIFIHLESGRRGEITEIPPGGTVEVAVYAGDDLPDDEAGRMARAMGVTRAEDFQQPDTLSLDSISVHRPRVGAHFGLETPRGFRSIEVVRHLEQGFVEVRVAGLGTAYTHASTLRDLATRGQADPSKWPPLGSDTAV